MVTDDEAYYIGENITKAFTRSEYKCETCGEMIHKNGSGQPGYRIGRNKDSLERLGIWVIYHHKNLKAVCSNCCAGKWIIEDIAEKMKLVKEIQEDLNGRTTLESQTRELFGRIGK